MCVCVHMSTREGTCVKSRTDTVSTVVLHNVTTPHTVTWETDLGRDRTVKGLVADQPYSIRSLLNQSLKAEESLSLVASLFRLIVSGGLSIYPRTSRTHVETQVSILYQVTSPIKNYNCNVKCKKVNLMLCRALQKQTLAK